MKSPLLTAFAVALGLMLMLIPSVSAAADVENCTPARNAVLAQAPTEVRCKFTEAVVLAGSSLAVFDANNNRVDNQDTKLDPADEDDMTLVVSLNTSKLSNGAYKVQWVSVAEEGSQRAEGQWSFSIGAGTPSPSETAADTDTATPPVDTPTSAETPTIPGPTPKDLPAGKGGVFIRNYYGQPLTFTMNNTEHTVPANDTLFVILDPDTYTYSANVFGDDDTEVMSAVEVKEGEIAERAFFLIARKHTNEPSSEEPEE
jgi:copper resistance protein C